MADRCRRNSWRCAKMLFKPDIEHFLCLVLFSMVSILGLALWTYEEGLFISAADRRRREDAAYVNILDSIVKDEIRRREEREAEFPEFPLDESIPDVLQRHRDRPTTTEEPRAKDRRILKKINRKLKPTRRKPTRTKGKLRGKNSTVVEAERLGDVHGGESFCKLYDTKADVKEDFECIKLSFKPPVQVCLYPEDVDVHISHHLRSAGIWEPHILRHFQNLLYQDPELGVYDIGANIGEYSLLAAAMGRRVVAVEPYIPSLHRLHKAIKLGQLEDKIIVIQNAVSDHRDTFELSIPSDNQGGVSLTSQDADRFCTEPECPPHATTIVMDDLLEVTNFEKAIMKIDIEGHEHRAFIESKRLFQTVDIQYIIMEWIKLREYYGSEAHESGDKRLVFELVDYLVEMGYTPRGSLLLDKLDPAFWYGWPDDIFWESSDARRPPTARNSTKPTSTPTEEVQRTFRSMPAERVANTS